jgi:hypothetical protein
MMMLANQFTQPFIETWQVIQDILWSPRGLLMVAVIVGVYVLSALTPRRTQLTSGRFATWGDKLQATRLAYQQLGQGRG